MNASTFFLLGMIAGLLLVIEGISLRRSGGRFSALVTTITLLELGWLILCVYAVFTIDFPAWTLLIPAAYFAYFIAATWQYLPMHAPDKVRGLSDIKIPVSFASVEIIFGLCLLALNVLAWVQFAEQLASVG